MTLSSLSRLVVRLKINIYRAIIFSITICFVSHTFLVNELRAQPSPIISIDKIFDQFSGVTVWGSYVSGKSDYLPGRYGFELLIGPYPQRYESLINDSLHTRKLRLVLDSLSYDSLTKCDRNKLINITNALDRINDISFSDNRYCEVEIGLGLDYSFSYKFSSDSFHVNAPVLGYYLSAYVEFPSLLNIKFLHLIPYLGAVGGYYNIWNGTADRDMGNPADIDAKTFSVEGFLGMSLDYGFGQLILEFGYQRLVFEGVHYIVGNTKVDGPTKLDFSGPTFTLGVQLARKK